MCRIELDLVGRHEHRFPDDFIDWLPDNLHVWDAFEDEVFTVIEARFSHYSARTILHFLRHHSAVREAGGAWKINDHHSPYLGELFDLKHPELAGLWEKRTRFKVLNK